MKTDDITIPHNPEAERAILSLACQDWPSLAPFAAVVTGLFHDPSHAAIWDMLLKIAQKHEPDLLILTSQLQASGIIDRIGGAAKVTGACTEFASRHMIGTYVETLQQAAQQREAIKILRENMQSAMSGQIDVAKAADDLQRLAIGRSMTELPSLREQIMELLDSLSRQDEIAGYPTGIEHFDKLLRGGVQKKELCTFSAETSGGKSIALVQAAVHACKAGAHVGIWTMEMPASTYLMRMFACAAQTSFSTPMGRQFSAYQMSSLHTIAEEVMGWNLHIFDYQSRIEEILSAAAMLKHQKKLDVAVIDYIQRASRARSGESREQEVSSIVRDIKSFCLANDVAGYTASQLNDDGKLRESRAIGHESDFVVKLLGDKLRIDKNRRGPRNIDYNCEINGALSTITTQGESES